MSDFELPDEADGELGVYVILSDAGDYLSLAIGPVAPDDIVTSLRAAGAVIGSPPFIAKTREAIARALLARKAKTN